MSRTFEDVASQELDVLFRGALFLSGGDAGSAEVLLSTALTSAFRARPRDTVEAPLEQSLQQSLVRSFLGEAGRPDDRRTLVDSPPASPGLGAFSAVGSDRLFSVAGVIPPWPRAAIWLVLVQRWSYQETADTLEVDRAVVVELLKYRDALVRELMRPSWKRTGLSGG